MVRNQCFEEYFSYTLPLSNRGKSDQLNYGVGEIGRTGRSYDLFMNIDTDSRVRPNFYRALAEIYTPDVHAYQKPVAWTKEFQRYPNSLTGWLMRSFCMLQTFHSFSNEVPMLNNWPIMWRLKYLVGNGMGIRPEILKAIGGFPAIIDDTRLGHILSLKGFQTKVIPSPGVVEGPKDLITQVKQSSVWFFGCSLIHEDYRIAGEHNLANALKALSGYHQQLAWLLRGSGMVTCLLLSLIYAPNLLPLGIMALLVNSSIAVGLVYTTINLSLAPFESKDKVAFSIRELIGLLLSSPFMYIFGCFGTTLGLYRLTKYLLTRAVFLPKTER